MILVSLGFGCGSTSSTPATSAPSTGEEKSGSVLDWGAASSGAILDGNLDLPYDCPGGGEITAAGVVQDCKTTKGSTTYTTNGTLTVDDTDSDTQEITWDESVSGGGAEFDTEGSLDIDDDDLTFDLTLTIGGTAIGLQGQGARNVDSDTISGTVTITVDGDFFATCTFSDFDPETGDADSNCTFEEEPEEDDTLALCSETQTSSNDFYTVESGSCDAADGLLVRINPDVPCKEIILQGLSCPNDFVMESSTVGYLSEAPGDGSSGDGNIYQVNISTKRKTLINDGANREFDAPKGLSMLLFSDANDSADIGCFPVTTSVLYIADFETDGGGKVWQWCISTSSLVDSPSPILRLDSDDLLSDGSTMENPIGVMALDNGDVLVTAQRNPMGGAAQDGAVIRQVYNTTGGTILGQNFTINIATVILDTDEEHALIVDSGLAASEGAVYRINVDDPTQDLDSEGNFPVKQSGLNNPWGIAFHPDGTNYLISEIGDSDILSTALAGDAAGTAVVTTLSAPRGIAAP